MLSLVLKLKMSGALPPLPHTSAWGGARDKYQKQVHLFRFVLNRPCDLVTNNILLGIAFAFFIH
jgi:hypothetical protein